ACVPTTDGKAPKSLDIDKLAINISSAPKDTAFVFNCQMSRGMTTTGTTMGHQVVTEGRVDPVSKGRTRVDASHAFGINDILLLWKITRFFENGLECREALDAVIDRCSALQNIRQVVLRYQKLFNQQHTE
ncbi:paladin isoform X1, partial [Tanacetum coccineum]